MLGEVGCSYGCSMVLCHIHILRSKKLVLNVANAGNYTVYTLYVCLRVNDCDHRIGGGHTVSQWSCRSLDDHSFPGNQQGREGENQTSWRFHLTGRDS